MTPEQMQVFRWEREIDERNRPLTDDELDAILPKEGYKVRKCCRCALGWYANKRDVAGVFQSGESSIH